MSFLDKRDIYDVSVAIVFRTQGIVMFRFSADTDDVGIDPTLINCRLAVKWRVEHSFSIKPATVIERKREREKVRVRS